MAVVAYVSTRAMTSVFLTETVWVFLEVVCYLSAWFMVALKSVSLVSGVFSSIFRMSVMNPIKHPVCFVQDNCVELFRKDKSFFDEVECSAWGSDDKLVSPREFFYLRSYVHTSNTHHKCMFRFFVKRKISLVTCTASSLVTSISVLCFHLCCLFYL